jgi:hypothetical protein
VSLLCGFHESLGILRHALRDRNALPVIEQVTRDEFAEALAVTVRDRLSLAQQIIRLSISSKRLEALTAAKSDRAKAASIFDELHYDLRSPLLEPETAKLCSIFVFSSEAYLKYRLGEFDAARTRLSASLAVAERLELDHGYGILQLHRIQIIQNLARLYLIEGRSARSVAIATKALRYVAGLSQKASIHGHWDVSNIRAAPLGLVHRMSVQLADEIALTLLRSAPNISMFAYETCGLSEIALSRSLSIDDSVRAWIEVLGQVLRAEEPFLENAANFVTSNDATIMSAFITLSLLAAANKSRDACKADGCGGADLGPTVWLTFMASRKMRSAARGLIEASDISRFCGAGLQRIS